MDDVAEILNGARWLLMSDEDKHRVRIESDPVAKAESQVVTSEDNLLKSLMSCHRLGIDVRHVF